MLGSLLAATLTPEVARVSSKLKALTYFSVRIAVSRGGSSHWVVQHTSDSSLSESVSLKSPPNIKYQDYLRLWYGQYE